MTTAETILSALLVSIISSIMGIKIGTHRKVSEKECIEHRESYARLICQKIDSISQRLDELKKAVDSKLLGL